MNSKMVPRQHCLCEGLAGAAGSIGSPRLRGSWATVLIGVRVDPAFGLTVWTFS